MQKYIRGLLYGNRKTKCYLWGMTILFAITIITMVYAIAASSLEVGIIAIFAGVLALVLVNSISFQRLEHTENNQKEQRVKNAEKKRGHNTDSNSLEAKNEDEENVAGKDDTQGQYLRKYSEKKLQSILKENKIKKVNVPVMIDCSGKYNIKQCPAYIWRDKNNFYLLLLEKQIRKIAIPLSTLQYIGYHPNVQANVKKDYKYFQESSFIGKMFEEFLPTYYNGQGRETYLYKKNLYSIAPDICFTNTSARNLMKILNLNVNIKHPSLDKEEYAQYYQLLYQYNILWKDGVITIKEYQNKIKQQLKSIADSMISAEEYRAMIMKFMKYRWITDEYADFFIGYKEKSEQRK